jgi:hypothetical protein
VTYGTYLGKGQDVSLAKTVVLSQRNKWVPCKRKEEIVPILNTLMLS